MGRDVFDGMTRLKQLHILKAIFKCVLFLHNKTPKVFCLTFGVHVMDGEPFSVYFTRSLRPIWRVVVSLMPFRRQSALTVVPFFLAILPRVSPERTV